MGARLGFIYCIYFAEFIYGHRQGDKTPPFHEGPRGRAGAQCLSYHANNTAQKTPSSIINNPQSTVAVVLVLTMLFKLRSKRYLGFFFFFLTWCLSEQGKNSAQLLDATDLKNVMIKRNCASSIFRAILLESYEVRNFRFLLYPLGYMTSFFFWQFHYAW